MEGEIGRLIKLIRKGLPPKIDCMDVAWSCKGKLVVLLYERDSEDPLLTEVALHLQVMFLRDRPVDILDHVLKKILEEAENLNQRIEERLAFTLE